MPFLSILSQTHPFCVSVTEWDPNGSKRKSFNPRRRWRDDFNRIFDVFLFFRVKVLKIKKNTGKQVKSTS